MILAWDNKGDVAVVTASSQIATLPGSNVQHPHVAKKWHTAAGVKSANLLVDMGSQVACSLFAFLGTNVTKNGSMRLRASPTSAGLTSDVLFDTGTIDAARSKALLLPGTTGNYASTPDSAALDITGDIDLRVHASLNDWTPAGQQTLVSKFSDAGNQRGYMLRVQIDGKLSIEWSTDGTGPGYAALLSTVAPTVADGVKLWVRATLDVDNGAAQHEAKFYTSMDYNPASGTGTWTQLGATVTAAGATGIFNSSAPGVIGAYEVGVSSLLVGRVYYAEIRNGINGPVVARFDPDADAAVGATTFTSSETRELWTINQSGSPKAEILIPANAGVKAGYGALYAESALAYLNLPGSSGNYASTPDSAGNSITGDIDLRGRLSLVDWTPAGANQTLVAKRGGTVGTSSYLLRVQGGSGGLLTLAWSADGSAELVANSTVAPNVTDGASLWIRATLDVDNGAAGRNIKFYTSTDYHPATGAGTWTQLGDTVTQAGVTSIFNSPSIVEVGSSVTGTSEQLNGRIYYAEIRNGIDGQVVAAFDPSRASASGATSLIAATGETWTINQSGSPKAELLIDEFVKARYWRVDITDNSLPDNLQVGRLFLGPSWEFDDGLQFEWSATALDESRVYESHGGQAHADERPKRRVLRFEIDEKDEASMYGNAFKMAIDNGVVKEVLAIPFKNGAYLSEQAVFGLVRESTPLIHRKARIFRQQFEIRETL